MVATLNPKTQQDAQRRGFHRREGNDDLMIADFLVSGETDLVSSPYYVDKPNQIWYSLGIHSSIHSVLAILRGEGYHRR